MSKDTIDYSNTMIYKIFCNNPHITDIYVGHTTNFIKRKYQHKILCNSSKKIKIYNIIQENGGWDNWSMIEIAKYNCKDLTEAKIREQEHYDLLKPTLNSVNPITNNKYRVLAIENSIKFENDEKKNDINDNHINKYNCQECDYSTSRQSHYDRHLQTDKHKILQNPTTKSFETKWNCNCGKKYKHSSTLYAHKKYCNNEYTLNPEQKFNQQVIETLIKITQNGTINHSNNTNTNIKSHNKTFNLNFFLHLLTF